MKVDTSHNGAFSNQTPGLQVVWDSTSLGTFKECPRKYYYTIICGYAIDAVPLEFGIMVHSALEFYDKEIAKGTEHHEALIASVRNALEISGKRDENGVFHPWDRGDTARNRVSLIRLLVWYAEQFKDDPAETVVFEDGTPAVELSFKIELPFASQDGEQYTLSGHLDRVVKFNDQYYVQDRKSTKTALSQSFFDKYSPDNQMTTYYVAGQMAYAFPVKAIMIDGIQVAVNFVRFQRGFASRHPSHAEEWINELPFWLRQAEEYAKAEYWPMNDKSCGNYGGCPFRNVCSKAPSMRDEWLKADFSIRTWDPSLAR